MEHLRALAEVAKKQVKREEGFGELQNLYKCTEEGFAFLSTLLVSQNKNATIVRKALCEAIGKSDSNTFFLYKVEIGTRTTTALEIDLRLVNKGRKNQKLQAVVIMEGYKSLNRPQERVYPKNPLVKQKELSRKMLRGLISSIEATFISPEAEEYKIQFVEAIGKAFSPASISKKLREILFDKNS